MHTPDPIPVMTLDYLERQGEKQDAIDEAYDSLSAGLLHALLTDPDQSVQPSDAFPATATAIVFDDKHHTTLGDALARVVVETLMDAYRAGDPRAVWAVDTIVHDHASAFASDVASDFLE